MAKEPFAQFLDYLMNKYTTLGTYVTNPDNIVIGESMSMVTRPDADFPRLEFLISKLKYDGYTDQRVINQTFRFSVGGHLRRAQDDTTKEDMFDAIKWGRELVKLMYEIHNDVIAGNFPCDGFIQMSGFPEVFMEYELFPKITSVILVAEAEIQLYDDFTNN